MTSVLRPHTDHQRVTFVELFFGLVYVFAVTQLSHLLLGNLSVDVHDLVLPHCHYFGEVVVSRGVFATTSPK